ncbi:leukocyte receptor cluster member 8-like isoform X1 [Quillaja saponaria]|uniref:Leukocyte receptor cluster member 8-like isoform X1 n=1 Tax=Quillaja saponaria TaxID=32244 RepID=A0AAD7L553_QUISA|nr:leukocyte receptor cluster member 8-like isoform X1 [Quillaja saponaria]
MPSLEDQHKTAPSHGPNLHEFALQGCPSLDTRIARNLQIPTNPRIASNLTVGFPKTNKDNSTTGPSHKRVIPYEKEIWNAKGEEKIPSSVVLGSERKNIKFENNVNEKKEREELKVIGDDEVTIKWNFVLKGKGTGVSMNQELVQLNVQSDGKDDKQQRAEEGKIYAFHEVINEGWASQTKGNKTELFKPVLDNGHDQCVEGSSFYNLEIDEGLMAELSIVESTIFKSTMLQLLAKVQTSFLDSPFEETDDMSVQCIIFRQRRKLPIGSLIAWWNLVDILNLESTGWMEALLFKGLEKVGKPLSFGQPF